MNAQAILRDLDWRFLLPFPPGGRFQHLVLLGATDAHASALLSLSVAERVSTVLTSGADALVVLGGAQVSLQDVTRCLNEKGVLYHEFDRRERGFERIIPVRLDRAIRRAGLSPVATYWITSQGYVPVAAPQALRWYLATLHRSSTWIQEARAMTFQSAVAMSGRLVQYLVPRSAVISAAGTAARRRPIAIDHIDLLDISGQEPVFPILLSDLGDRVVALPFCCGDRHPRCVVKIPKHTEFNGRTLNEQRVLKDIRQHMPDELRESVPDPLSTVEIDDTVIAVQSFLPGKPLRESTGRRSTRVEQKIEDLRLATDWLIDFHNQVLVRSRPWVDTDISQWIDHAFQQYEQLLGSSDAVDDLYRSTRLYAESLVGLPFPEVWQHRDYNIWNILRNGGELAVIDWDGGRVGLPLCDLLHFVTHWQETARGLTTEEARLDWFHRIFLQHYSADPLSQSVHDAINRYVTGVKLDSSFLPLLLVYMWVELALRRAYQLRDAGEADDALSVRNRNIDYVEALARHADVLFRIRTRA